MIGIGTKATDTSSYLCSYQGKEELEWGNTSSNGRALILSVFKNFGFNVAWRWSDTYFWQATFGDGDVPSFHTLDAQLSYSIPKLKSVIKVGGTNLLGDDYFTAIGTGFIGSMYYASIVINNL